MGDPTLENRILSAVTGKEVDEEGLYRIGERIFNVCRAMLVREGHHGRDADILPDYLHTLPFALASSAWRISLCWLKLTPVAMAQPIARHNHIG